MSALWRTGDLSRGVPHPVSAGIGDVTFWLTSGTSRWSVFISWAFPQNARGSWELLKGQDGYSWDWFSTPSITYFISFPGDLKTVGPEFLTFTSLSFSTKLFAFNKKDIFSSILPASPSYLGWCSRWPSHLLGDPKEEFPGPMGYIIPPASPGSLQFRHAQKMRHPGLAVIKKWCATGLPEGPYASSKNKRYMEYIYRSSVPRPGSWIWRLEVLFRTLE